MYLTSDTQDLLVSWKYYQMGFFFGG